jgi:hypothetical protein
MDNLKIFVIKYEKNVCLGGFGDRIVGLIAVKLISKILKGKFYILWEKENITKYLNYKKYDYKLLEHTEKDIKVYHLIDKPLKLKEYLINSTKLFPNRVNEFILNQEISQYIYKNILYDDKNYLLDIFSEYKKLYTDILIPNIIFNKKVENLVSNKTNIVGIQIRCGDFYMITNPGENYQNNITNFIKILSNIKNKCEEKYKNNYNIFFTTDNINLLQDVYNMFDKTQIIYNNDLIQHLDRNSIDDDISKTFIDNYILSQKTEMLFIDPNSNFGRIAALSSIHNNIYNTYDIKVVDKKKLLSKAELLF